MTAVLALALLFAAPAQFTIDPERARPGQTRTVTFRMASPRNASTVRVDVLLPTTEVAVRPLAPAGWTVRRVGDELRWTARRGHAIAPGADKGFKVRLGPLPDVTALVFQARRHHADGRIVRFVGVVDPAPVVLLLRESEPVAIDGAGFDGHEEHTWVLIAVLVAFCGVVVAGLLAAWRFWRV